MLLSYEDEKEGYKRYEKQIRVKLDEKGNILDYIGPRKEYTSIISKDDALSMAKKEDTVFDAEDVEVELIYEDEAYGWNVISKFPAKSKFIELN